MTEDIRIKLKADEKGAVAAFQRLRNEVFQTEAGIKRVGAEGKTMGAALAASAQLLGPEFGALGGQVSAMAEALEKLPQSGLLVKAGLIGAVGAAGLFIGNTIGNWIWQTEKWTAALEKAREEFKKADQGIVKSETAQRQKQVEAIAGLPAEEQVQARADAIARVQSELATKASQMQRLQKEIEGRDWGMLQTADFAEETKTMEANLQAAKDRSEMLKEQLKQLHQINPEETRRNEELAKAKEAAEAAAKAEAERVKQMEAQAAAQQRLQESQLSYLEGLELELLRLKEGEAAYERARLQRQGFSDDTIEQAMQLRAEIDALRAAQGRIAETGGKSGGGAGGRGLGPPGTVQATEQRFLTRGAGIRGEDKLLKAQEAMLAKLDAQTRATERAADTLDERLPKVTY